jgi:hypothetical protein
MRIIICNCFIVKSDRKEHNRKLFFRTKRIMQMLEGDTNQIDIKIRMPKTRESNIIYI